MMVWDEILGHERQKQWFENAMRAKRLASTFLFVGSSGIGKRRLAISIAKSLLCLRRSSDSYDACQACESCVQIDAGTNPDLLLASKPADKASLPMELLVGSVENRLRDGICYQLHIKPFHGHRRIAIIDDADTIQGEAANSMLKTLEEPPPGAVIFLIGTNEQRQLPTIRSRSQVVRFQPLSKAHVAKLLVRNGLIDDLARAEEIASISNGSYARAAVLADEDFRQLHREISTQLSTLPIPILALSKRLLGHLTSLGDDSQLKRERFRMMMDFAIEYFRSQFSPSSELDRNSTGVASNSGHRHLPLPMLASALELCLSTQNDIDRNATPAGLIEHWSTELASICQR
jgi:DNA polymerase III subunit delta'